MRETHSVAFRMVGCSKIRSRGNVWERSREHKEENWNVDGECNRFLRLLLHVIRQEHVFNILCIYFPESGFSPRPVCMQVELLNHWKLLDREKGGSVGRKDWTCRFTYTEKHFRLIYGAKSSLCWMPKHGFAICAARNKCWMFKHFI